MSRQSWNWSGSGVSPEPPGDLLPDRPAQPERNYAWNLGSWLWHVLCLRLHAMTRPRRVIVVRPGDAEVYERLRERFANDPDTVVIYDRRSGPRRGAGSRQRPADERRSGERRFPQDHAILLGRGFYVARPRPAR